MRNFKKDFWIGLDLGFSSVKLVQFAKSNGSFSLLKVGFKEWSSSEDNTIREKERLPALQDLLRGIDVKKSKFFVSFNSPETALQVVTVPVMPAGELKEGLKFEAKNYFPFPVEDSGFDFEIAGTTLEKEIKKYRVAMAATSPKTVQEILLLLKKAGLRPASLVPVSYALQKLGGTLSGDENNARCFLDIGSRTAELVILKGKNLLFVRKIPIGGEDFTNALVGILVSDRGRTSLALEEAEDIKRQVGIPDEGQERIIGDKISTKQILSLIRSPLEQLSSEIERCFDYYREETGGGRVDSLTLCGRGALLKGLNQVLSHELGIETKVWNSWEGFKIENHAPPPEEGFASFAAAMGAALSGSKGMNLLPPEMKQEMKRTVRRAAWESAGAAVILFFVLIAIGMQIQSRNFEKRIVSAKSQLVSFQPEMKNAVTQNLLQETLADQPYWEDVFKELSNIVPDDVVLTELGMKNKKMVMKGVITSKENKEAVLSRFILDLEKGLFKGVKLVTTRERMDKSATEFELEFWVD